MFDKEKLTINIPQPFPCTGCSKGMVVALLRPVTAIVRDFEWGPKEAWGDKYEVVYKCSECGKVTR